VEIKKVEKSLILLAIAGLISEGEFDLFQDGAVLKVPFDTKKTLYLMDYIKEHRLEGFVEINLKRGQFSIHSHPALNQLKEQWYKNMRKIFSMVLDPQLLNLQSIIMSINLFGIRKSESLTIPTSIDKEHIKTVSYCIEQLLKVTIIPTPTSIKVTNIPTFIMNSIKEIPATHSAELINFLTEKEKKKIIEGATA